MTKRRKTTKPATEAQERARERNWNKGQILCIRTIARNIHKSKTTKHEEKSFLILIETELNKILENWDK